MKLIECYIENFGTLSEYRHSFTDGLNCIKEDNGKGKTTLSVFIKAMLFGLEDTKKVKLEENDRKHYLPWQGGRFGGFLVFESAEGRFRIERSFGSRASEDELKVYDCSSGKLTDIFGEIPGEKLFGIDADGFERTVFLSERRLSVKNENKTVSAKLSDLVGVECDMTQLDTAVEKLEERRKYYHKKGGRGRISDIKDELSATEREISDLTRLKDVKVEKEAELVTLKSEIVLLEEKKQREAEIAVENAYKKQYFDMVDGLSKVKERLCAIEEDFIGTPPTFEEVHSAELGINEYKRLKILTDDPIPAADRKVLDTADKYAKEISQTPILKNANKSYHIFFVASAVTAVTGAVLGLFVSIFLYTVCLFSLICAFCGISNLKTVKERRASLLSLKPAMDFAENQLGWRPDANELFTVLAGIKAKEEARLSVLIEKKRVAERIKAECESHLENYTRLTARYKPECQNPLEAIKEAIGEREYLCRDIPKRTAQIAEFAKAHGIDPVIVATETASTPFTPVSTDTINSIRNKAAIVERECKRLGDELSRIDELCERRLELTDAYNAAVEKHNAILQTKKHLLLAKDNITAKYLGKTRSAFGEYIYAIGAQNGEDFSMDTGFSVTKSEGGKSMPTEAYSLGTRDFYSLAARLALIDALYENEVPFVILDDPFVHMDDAKTAAATKILSTLSEKRQIIYFTCSESRMPQ